MSGDDQQSIIRSKQVKQTKSFSNEKVTVFKCSQQNIQQFPSSVSDEWVQIFDQVGHISTNASVDTSAYFKRDARKVKVWLCCPRDERPEQRGQRACGSLRVDGQRATRATTFEWSNNTGRWSDNVQPEQQCVPGPWRGSEWQSGATGLSVCHQQWMRVASRHPRTTLQ